MRPHKFVNTPQFYALRHNSLIKVIFRSIKKINKNNKLNPKYYRIAILVQLNKQYNNMLIIVC